VDRGLPSGTVSFLFADVEGSTRLLQKPGSVESGDTPSGAKTLVQARLYGSQTLGTRTAFAVFAEVRGEWRLDRPNVARLLLGFGGPAHLTDATEPASLRGWFGVRA
jgi:hypothetical protein